MQMATALLLLATLFAQSKPQRAVADRSAPKILLDAFRYRTSFKTAAFQVRVEQSSRGGSLQARNLEMRWADEVLYQKDTGDDDGFLVPASRKTGEYPIGIWGVCTSEERVFDVSKNELWIRKANSPICSKSSTSDWIDYVDFRSLGLRSIECQRKSVQDQLNLFQGSSRIRYSVEPLENGFVRIHGVEDTQKNGFHFEYQWEIDAKKGPSIVKSNEWVVHPSGKREATSEMKCSLAQFDDKWWPIIVEGWNIGGKTTRVRFNQIEFDRPEHPKRIDADFLGIPAGADVTVAGVEGRNHYLSNGVVVDHATWEATKVQHDPRPLEIFRFKARIAGTAAFPDWWEKPVETLGFDDLADRPDLWEAYVRRWVIKHSNHHAWKVVEPLTDTQKTAARGILDDCRKRAVPIRDKLDQRRAAVVAQLAQLKEQMKAKATSVPTAGQIGQSTGGSTATAKPGAEATEIERRISTLQRKSDELEKSHEIQRIFSELRSRLEGLLTSTQADPNAAHIEKPKPSRPPKRPASHSSPAIRPTSRPSVVRP